MIAYFAKTDFQHTRQTKSTLATCIRFDLPTATVFYRTQRI